ncbi:hypothetical protein HPB48_001717 [Haemaphysalis longicornis]|uniref:Mutator-like transposase domain-containing protein n=1 Tax=Haemaphysalis longicornis TaxID=44386 RepID=A0A9J6GZ20_HAELO|nr:hypothetical protein HPB48_001717 [Haemaphysalis longicornis]
MADRGNIEAIADEVGLTAPPASGNATESGCIRRNTVMLQPEDVLQREVFVREQLKAFSSTPATERKSNLVTSADDTPPSPPDESSFVIASLDCANVLLSAVKCRVCDDSATFGTGKRAYGLSIKMVIACVMCSDIASEWSSPRVNSNKKVNPFVMNVLATRAMQTTGNCQTALSDVFTTMNISHHELHTTMWQGYVKEKLVPAATRAADVMATSARSVRKLYDGLQLGNPSNNSVMYDGLWMTRGHSSHIGVGVVIQLFTGLVLDFVVFSNFCAGCERGPKVGDPAYQAWKDNHVCQKKNTEKKADEVEVEAGLILFERPLQRHNLRYTTILSDGDSRTYLALVDAKVYGFVPTTKEDCVNHVKKRMGTFLHNLLAKGTGSASERLGGKGRLTGDLIIKQSSYYGWALKLHSGDVRAMHKAVMATYHLITSNDTVSNHSLCPPDPDSWRRGSPHQNRYNLPPHMCKDLLPEYERFSDEKLLQRCLQGKTQNSNESLHSMIWALAPKEKHASLFTVQAAVA